MLISTRTPLRVSLFGGGTDYPAFFQRERGAVIGFAVNKYIYISALPLQSFVDYRYRVSYSTTEIADGVEEIAHPVVRAALTYYGYDQPTDFSIQADLPASSGLGSSSSFTVGFIGMLSALSGTPRTKLELARAAIHLEQVLLAENVGVQDQLHAAFGGINRFSFEGDGITIAPINMTGLALRHLTGSMLLVHTGIKRRATAVVAEQIKRTSAREVDVQLRAMLGLVDAAQALLEGGAGDVAGELARLLDESWRLKRSLSSGISGGEIDDLYDFCRCQGALGGKLCGAGGGGFLLMVVPPERRAAFLEAVGPRRCVPIEVDMTGTVVLRSD